MTSDKSSRQNRVRDALGRLYDQQPPYFREYLRRFREDPTSRVFAPLAEAYRRLGRVDEAISICREGLEHHPEFHGGRVALAKCLIEKRAFDEAIEQLEKVVRAVPENLLAQRILGDAYLGRGRPQQALHCFKMALLLSPSDVALAERVHDLEKKLAEPASEPAPPAPEPVAAPEPSVPTAAAPGEDLFGDLPGVTPQFEDPSQWEALSGETVEPSINFPAPVSQEFHEKEDYGALWTDEDVEETGHTGFVEVGTPSDAPLPESPLLQEVDEVSKITDLAPADDAGEGDSDGELLLGDDDENDESYQVEHVSAVFGDTASKAGEITTETLGDLYFSQGQYEKALRIFEKLLSKGRSVELERKIHGCRVKLGVDGEALARNRKIASLRRVLNRVKAGS